jgi:hypothetical protein
MSYMRLSCRAAGSKGRVNEYEGVYYGIWVFVTVFGNVEQRLLTSLGFANHTRVLRQCPSVCISTEARSASSRHING